MTRLHILKLGSALALGLGWGAGACKLYDASSPYTGICELYARCEALEDDRISDCIVQHTELFKGRWSEQVACSDPKTFETIYLSAQIADLCSDQCQAARRSYLICLGDEAETCDELRSPFSVCEAQRVDYVQACPWLAADEPSVCGNGIIEGSEQCDDGNVRDDDACNNACVVHCGRQNFVVGPVSSSQRWGAAVAVDGEGRYVVAGTESVSSENSDPKIMVEKYGRDGSLLWSSTPVAPHLGDGIVGLAVDGSENIVAIGTVAEVQGIPRAWIGKFGEQGATIWSRDLGPDVDLHSIATAPGGSIYVSGTARADDGRRLWIARLNGTGDTVWTTIHGHKDAPFVGNDYGGPIVLGPGEQIYVLAEAGVEGGARRSYLVQFSTDGEDMGRETWGGEASVRVGPDQRSRALASDGVSLFYGIEEASSAGIWIHGVGPTGEAFFSISGPELEAESPPRTLANLVLANDGTLMLGGSGDDSRWVSRIDNRGDRICARFEMIAADEPSDVGICMGSQEHSTSPHAVGYVERPGGSAIWIGEYRP